MAASHSLPTWDEFCCGLQMTSFSVPPATKKKGGEERNLFIAWKVQRGEGKNTFGGKSDTSTETSTNGHIPTALYIQSKRRSPLPGLSCSMNATQELFCNARLKGRGLLFLSEQPGT